MQALEVNDPHYFYIVISNALACLLPSALFVRVRNLSVKNNA
jgi:hypothetical protein